MITSVGRNHIEGMIAQAQARLIEARDVASLWKQPEVVERLAWALDFTEAAMVKLSKEET